MILNLLAVSWIFQSCAEAVPLLPIKMIDMTYVLDDTTLRWPGSPNFKLEALQNGTILPQGYWLQIDKFSSGTHAGTHMDAPCHFARGHRCMDQIPVEHFTAPAAVINITRRAQEDKDYLATVQDLEDWERRHGHSLDNSIILLKTGWGQKWPKREEYFGSATEDRALYHFPGLSEEAATFLVHERINVLGVGTDCGSIDRGATQEYMAHRILTAADKFILENVANVEQIPEFGAVLRVFPMKIGNASGAPVRIIAEFLRI